MANTAIYRSLSQNYGTGGGITTISFWFKRCRPGTNEVLTSSYYSGSYYGQFQLGSNDKLTIQDWRSSNVYSKTTNRVFRDCSAWYHVCWSFNNRTGGSSSSNLWINGELITDWASETEYSYQATTSWNTDYTHYIGCLNTSSSQAYFSGVIADYYFIQGQEYAASIFGETDSTTGEWKPKTSPTIDYTGTGNNSCHLKFEDASNLDLDSGGNTLTFTTSGAGVTQTQDNPSNNFCTISPLDNMAANNTTVPGKLENANLSFTNNDSNQIYTRGTMGVSSGKYYWEAKQGSGTAWAIGICVNAMLYQTNNQFWDTTTVTGVAVNGSSGTLYLNGGQSDSWNTGISVDANTIYGFALDVDNRAFYVHVNGTYLTANSNVGDPTSGSSRTGSVLGELTTRGGTGGLNYIPEGEFIYPFMGDLSTSNSTNLQMNFGNGYFAATAISSEGTNAAGHGKFEYNVPAGYTALCTKGLNE